MSMPPVFWLVYNYVYNLPAGKLKKLLLKKISSSTDFKLGRVTRKN